MYRCTCITVYELPYKSLTFSIFILWPSDHEYIHISWSWIYICIYIHICMYKTANVLPSSSSFSHGIISMFIYRPSDHEWIYHDHECIYIYMFVCMYLFIYIVCIYICTYRTDYVLPSSSFVFKWYNINAYLSTFWSWIYMSINAYKYV